MIRWPPPPPGPQTKVFRLRLLGSVSIAGPPGTPLAALTQQRRLACLALLAASPVGTLSRDRLAAFLWPEKDAGSARHRLADTVHVLRKVLGKEAIRPAGDELSLDREIVSSDVADFGAALAAHNVERAAALYGGPFLDGFFVKHAPEFERWVEAERRRLACSFADALERLARDAEAAGELEGAIRWRRTLVAQEPYEAASVLRLMHALVAVGDRAGAVAQARAHGALLRDDIGIEPDPEIAALAERLARAPADAEELYLKGGYFLNARTRAGMLKAVECFERALSYEPGCARAHAALAETYLMLGSANHGVLPPQEALERARRSADCALAGDAELAPAHVALGIACMHAWDWEQAYRRLRRAIELDPQNAAAHHRFGWLRAIGGDLDGGLTELRRAEQLDPLSLPIRTAIGRIYEWMQRPDDAIAQYRRSLELDPGFADAHAGLGTALLRKAFYREAIATLRRARDIARTPGMHALLAFAHAAAGAHDAARALVRDLLDQNGRVAAPAAHLGDVCFALGDVDEGFAWYETAYRQRSPTLMYLKVDPLWPAMRDDPRWRDLVRRVGLEGRRGQPADSNVRTDG